jgi:hypothetical protein
MTKSAFSKLVSLLVSVWVVTGFSLGVFGTLLVLHPKRLNPKNRYIKYFMI